MIAEIGMRDKDIIYRGRLDNFWKGVNFYDKYKIFFIRLDGWISWKEKWIRIIVGVNQSRIFSNSFRIKGICGKWEMRKNEK